MGWCFYSLVGCFVWIFSKHEPGGGVAAGFGEDQVSGISLGNEDHVNGLGIG